MYPSTIASLTNPQATDRLNSPAHSTLHQSENTEITAIETFVGTLSSTQGSLMYDIRAAASDGGGHVQGVNKGGTGFTSYTKGDILVAQSSSVLTKLAAGVSGQILGVNSSVATGLTWVNSPGKIAVVSSVVFVGSIQGETSVMSAVVPASVLTGGTAVRATIFFSNITFGNQILTLTANYGTTSIASFAFNSGSVGGTLSGDIKVTVLSANASSQYGVFQTNLSKFSANTSVIGYFNTITNPVYVDGGAAQNIGLTTNWGGNSTPQQLTVGGYMVEKIA